MRSGEFWALNASDILGVGDERESDCVIYWSTKLGKLLFKAILLSNLAKMTTYVLIYIKLLKCKKKKKKNIRTRIFYLFCKITIFLWDMNCQNHLYIYGVKHMCGI